MPNPQVAELIEAVNAQTREVRALRHDLKAVQESPILLRPVRTIGQALFWFAVFVVAASIAFAVVWALAARMLVM